jgi:hypothetical protein
MPKNPDISHQERKGKNARSHGYLPCGKSESQRVDMRNKISLVTVICLTLVLSDSIFSLSLLVGSREWVADIAYA